MCKKAKCSYLAFLLQDLMLSECPRLAQADSPTEMEGAAGPGLAPHEGQGPHQALLQLLCQNRLSSPPVLY